MVKPTLKEVHDKKAAEKKVNADKFTGDMDKKLIELVREEPVLYDKANSNYKNDQLKNRKWALFAKVLSELATSSESSDIEIEDCKKRWKDLKDRFTKERSRLEKLLASESGFATATPLFKLFKDMLFLDVHISRRKQRKRKLLSSDVNSELETQNSSSAEDESQEVQSMLDPETGEIIEYSEVHLLNTLSSKDVPKKKQTSDTKFQNTSEKDTLHLLNCVSALTDAVVKKGEKNVKDPDLRSFCDTVYYQLQNVEKNKRLKYQLAILQAIDKLNDE